MSAYPRRKTGSGPDFETLRKELKSGSFKPLYFADGPDHHRLKSVVDYIVKKSLDGAAIDFNYHKYDGEQDDFSAMIQQAMSFPMMASTQIIWVRNADKILTDPSAEGRILDYIESPPTETILIFSADKFDGRKKWTKSAKQAGYFYDFSPPVGSALVTWTINMAAHSDLKLSLELAELLVDLVGDDQHAIEMELAKLSALVGDQDQMPDEKRLHEIIMANRPEDPFELVKEMGPGKLRAGMTRLRNFLDSGKSPYEIAPLLIWRIKQVAQVHDMLSEGQDADRVRDILGISPYAARQAISVARAWKTEDIKKALHTIYECEHLLKSSPLGPQQVLEKAVIEICS
jgi:DNA polymerase III subunit delta